MSREVDYDAIVVGGGPAGSICAFTLARKGHSVALLDKKKRDRIGDKTCGDALDKQTVDLLKENLGIDEPHGKEVSDIIRYMSIAANNIDNKATLTAPGYVVDRLEYAKRLLDLCEKEGVTIIPQAPVRDIIVENNQLCGVVFYQGNEKKSLKAHLTIDASGSYAVIRKKLPESMRYNGIISKEISPDMVWPTYREIIELNEGVKYHQWKNEIVLLYEKSIPIPGYFWIFSKGDNQLNIGIGWLKSEKNMPPLKEAFLKEMKKYYSQDMYRVLKSGGGQIPIRPPFDTLVFNGGALVGDAACLVHPTTAEGHGPALESGYYCALACDYALSKGDYSDNSLWQYNRQIMNHLGEKHAIGLLIRQFLENIGSNGLEYLIRKQFFTNEDLDKLVRGQKIKLSVFEQLKRVFRVFPKWGSILSLQRMIKSIDVVKQIYSQYPENPNELEKWRKLRNEKLNWNF